MNHLPITSQEYLTSFKNFLRFSYISKQTAYDFFLSDTT